MQRYIRKSSTGQYTLDYDRLSIGDRIDFIAEVEDWVEAIELMDMLEWEDGRSEAERLVSGLLNGYAFTTPQGETVRAPQITFEADTVRMIVDRLYIRWRNVIDAIEKAGLHEIMTPGEASEEYDIPESALLAAIEEERLPARRSAGIWLVRRHDVMRLWNKHQPHN